MNYDARTNTSDADRAAWSAALSGFAPGSHVETTVAVVPAVFAGLLTWQFGERAAHRGRGGSGGRPEGVRMIGISPVASTASPADLIRRSRW